ncbi:MAG: DUF983 domain-containing protein [Ilumatobacteraceae bacterium]|nr:DUF983 domain-containing protein [Ilumatobacteraceae bacterium]
MENSGVVRKLLRGALRRCPWCGGRGAFFVGWYKKADHCQTCGLGWRRDDVGYELGAAAITAIITFGPLILVLGGMVAVTWPDVEVGLMFAVLGVLAVVLPLLSYGSAYLIWQALDLTMRPPTREDFAPVGGSGQSSD